MSERVGILVEKRNRRLYMKKCTENHSAEVASMLPGAKGREIVRQWFHKYAIEISSEKKR